jgi:hypothetical protein
LPKIKNDSMTRTYHACLSPRQFLGVQRAKPFAGVRGVPEKLLFPFLPP